MKIEKAFLALAFLAVPLASHALDSGPNVKATPLIKTSESWNGAPISYPQGRAEVTGLIIEIAPGAETGWHLHPAPSFGMILQGTLEITLKDGKKKRLAGGEGFAEVINTEHNGRNVGDIPVRLVVFYAGTVGQPLAVSKP